MQRKFTSKELKPILSIAPSTTLTDCRSVRDNFTKIGHGEWYLNEGVSLEKLMEDCRLRRLERDQTREENKRIRANQAEKNKQSSW